MTRTFARTLLTSPTARMRLSVSNDLFAMTLLTSHWLFRDMACCGLKTLRTQLFCCSDYHIVYWTPHSVIYVPFVLTASLHIPKLLSWPLPVTRTLPVTWTLSVTWTSFMDLSSFVWHRLFVFIFCAYDQLIRHFSYLQHQWTSLFSLILLRALLWWHFWDCFGHWVRHLFYLLDRLLSFSAFFG